MPKMIEMAGKKFGRWTVMGESHRGNAGIYWNCLCDCGNASSVRGSLLRRGDSKSCGCLNKEIVTKHGLHGTRTYNSWHAMMDRCNNPNRCNYYNYGGMGITICQRWLEFKNFFADMGERPEGKTIERINNKLGYFKENCKWASPSEQQHNKRIHKKNKTGVTGVHWCKYTKKYRAYINAYRKRYYLGLFKTVNEAAVARKNAELKYWGKVG